MTNRVLVAWRPGIDRPHVLETDGGHLFDHYLRRDAVTTAIRRNAGRELRPLATDEVDNRQPPAGLQ